MAPDRTASDCIVELIATAVREVLRRDTITLKHSPATHEWLNILRNLFRNIVNIVFIFARRGCGDVSDPLVSQMAMSAGWSLRGALWKVSAVVSATSWNVDLQQRRYSPPPCSHDSLSGYTARWTLSLLFQHAWIDWGDIYHGYSCFPQEPSQSLESSPDILSSAFTNSKHNYLSRTVV